MVMSMEGRRSGTIDTIRLDGEGNWFQGEYPILHDRTCSYLHKHIELDSQGHFVLTGEDKPILIEIEDVPYWVTKVERTIAGFLVTLTDETIELLDPTTLWSKKKQALYCLVKGGRFACKFQRVPYYEITKELEQRRGKFYLVIGGKRYPIAKEPPASFLKAQAQAIKARKISLEEQKKKKKKIGKKRKK